MQSGRNHFDFCVGEFGKAGNADALGRPTFGFRATGYWQIAVRRLLGECQRIVDRGRNTQRRELLSRRLAVSEPRNA